MKRPSSRVRSRRGYESSSSPFGEPHGPYGPARSASPPPSSVVIHDPDDPAGIEGNIWLQDSAADLSLLINSLTDVDGRVATMSGSIRLYHGSRH